MELGIILPIALVLILILVFYLLRSKNNENNENDDLVNLEINENDIVNYTPSNSALTIFETELLDLINHHRTGLNLTRLNPERKCRELAYNHTKYMINEGKPSHDSTFKRKYELFKRGASLFGENVGFGYSTAQSFFNGYMKSSGHKKIIETEEFTHIGVRALKDNNNKYYNALIFTKF